MCPANIDLTRSVDSEGRSNRPSLYGHTEVCANQSFRMLGM